MMPAGKTNVFTEPEGWSVGFEGETEEKQSETGTANRNFPYETRLNILHGPLEVMDLQQMAAASTHKWFNQTLCQVNSSVVRVGIIEGEYHWHKHEEDDEFFFVVEGTLLIDLDSGTEGRTVELRPGQGFVVPRRVVHRTRAPQRTIILMVENAGIVPTGN